MVARTAQNRVCLTYDSNVNANDESSELFDLGVPIEHMVPRHALDAEARVLDQRSAND